MSAPWMFPSPLEFKWGLVQTPIPRVSEDTLGLSLLSVSFGSVFLPATLQPFYSGFLLLFPHLVPQFLHPETSLIHAICKHALSKEENHGGDDVPGQNDLKRILTFLNLKIPGPFFLMASSSHACSIQVVLGPSWGHCWRIRHFSKHFFKKAALLQQPWQYSAQQQKVGQISALVSLHLALVPIFPLLTGPQSLKFSFISYRAG